MKNMANASIRMLKQWKRDSRDAVLRDYIWGLSEVRQIANCKGIPVSLFNLVLELVSLSSSDLFCLLNFDKIF